MDLRQGAPQPARIEVLDALRGIAALAVVGYHYTTRYGELFGASPLGFSFAYGAKGVNLFFIISGFVIFMTLNATTRVSDFLVSRGSRLYPAFWMAVTLTALVMSFAGLPGREVSLRQYLLNLTMLQEFVHVPAVDGVYWTLTIELRFYFWMLMLWMIGGLARPHWFVLPWLGLTLLRHQLPAQVSANLLLEYFPLFGYGIAMFALHRSAWRAPWAWCMAVCALLAGGLGNAPLMLLFAAIVRYQPRLLHAPVLVWLGAISYPLYLVHQNIGYAILRSCGGGASGLALALAAAFMLAWLIHARIEKPALRSLRSAYRRHFPPQMGARRDTI